jgi:ketosteroid isomerase-like protein
MSEESTPPDLVELVRPYFHALSRRDFDAMVAFYAPDPVWKGWGAGDTFAGRTAIRAFGEAWVGTFEEFAIEADEILDLGNGVVVAAVRQDARLSGSTGHLRVRNAHVFEWVDGALVRCTVYPDIDEARAAAERLAEERG